MKIKKILAILLIIAIQQLSFCCIANTEELNIVKSYYLLKYEYEEFLTPLLYSGGTEPELVAFFNDIEIGLKKINGITKENFEKHFRDVLINVATYRTHRNISSVIFSCYEKEIMEYMETYKVPEKLTGAYNALLKILFGTEADDKVELATIYEKYKKTYDAGLSGYTVASAERFSACLANTLAVLKNKEATIDEIINSRTELVSAYSNLERKPQVPSSPSGPSGGSPSGPAGGSSGGSSGGTSGGGSSSGLPVQQPDSTLTPVTQWLFNDLSDSHWSFAAVKYLVDKNVINGFEDKTFRPEQLVTREEFSKMLCIALNLAPASTYTEYTDVEENAWYDDYLQRVTANNIMQGTGNKLFGVGETLIRQDLAVIAYRLIQNGTIVNDYTQSTEYTPFDDLNSASEYARESIEVMKKYSIINGIGNNLYAPHNGVTRAQAAQIIYSLVK